MLARSILRKPYWDGTSKRSQPPFLIERIGPTKYSQWYSEPGINSESDRKLRNSMVNMGINRITHENLFVITAELVQVCVVVNWDIWRRIREKPANAKNRNDWAKIKFSIAIQLSSRVITSHEQMQILEAINLDLNGKKRMQNTERPKKYNSNELIWLNLIEE